MSFEILGLGSYLPPRIVDNDEAAALSGVSATHIREIFEIEERRWVRGKDTAAPQEGRQCSDLAVAAARAALDDAGVAAAAVDTVIAVSTTPDFVNPSLDYLLAAKLGVGEFFGVPLPVPYTGLFRAAQIADALFAAGRSRLALIVTAEAISPFFRFGPDVAQGHRLNSVLYADGAAAIVAAPPASGRESPLAPSRAGVFAIHTLTSGREEAPGLSFRGMLSAIPPSPEAYQSMEYLGHHDFRRVLRRGSAMAYDAAKRVMAEASVSLDDVRFLVTHQATGNIHRIGAPFGIPAHKVPVNISHVGNTISASILILLDELYRGGKLNTGDLLVLHTAESSSWSQAGMALRWR